MATIIDSLIVTLGLDPRNFRKGVKEVTDGLKDTTEAAEDASAAVDKVTDSTRETGRGAEAAADKIDKSNKKKRESNEKEASENKRRKDAETRQTADRENKEREERRRTTETKRRAIRETEGPEKEEIRRGKEHANTIGQVRTQLIGLFALVTAGRGLEEFVKDSINSSAGLGRLSTNIGVSTDAIAAFQTVVKQNGGSSADALTTLQALSQAYQDITLRGDLGKSSALMGLGLSLGDLQNPMEALRKLTEAKGRMSGAEFTNRVSELGVSAAAIPALENGRGTFDAQMAAATRRAPSAADIAAAQKMQAMMEALKTSSEKLGRGILTALAPALEWLTDKLTKLGDWAATHGEFVKVTFIGIAAGVAAFAIALAAPLLPMVALAGAIAAGAAAMGLLIDDFNTWKNGGPSSIDWSGISDAVSQLADAFGELGDAFKQAYDAVPPQVWSTLWTVFKTVASQVIKGITNQVYALADALKAVASLLHGDWRGALGHARDYLGDELGVRHHDAPHPTPRPGAGRSALGDIGSAARGTIGSMAQWFQSHGWSATASRGIAAGVWAESKGNPTAFNSKGGGHGAYGIGQWRGARQAQLFATYGRNPTLDQQLQFLNWEMTQGIYKGAGKAISGAGTAYGAAGAYIRGVMIPGAAGVASDMRGVGAALAMPPGASGRSSTSSSKTDIHQITINDSSGSPHHIARGIGNALSKYPIVQQVNTGMSV